MIDFNNKAYFKLKFADNKAFNSIITPILIEGEQIFSTFQSMRDGVVFTNMRILAINVQGITGKKKDISSLPYSKIQAFSVESAGVFDLDSELELWFSSLGKVKFEFTGSCDISALCKLISQYTLK